MMQSNDADLLLKIVIIGESGVGKTNLVGRYVHDTFSDEALPTVGVDFTLKTMEIKGKMVKTQFWDTAGQEKLKAITTAYYKNANGAILVYDIAKKESFKRLVYWIKELRDSASENVKVILLGNKNDLVAEREVALEEAKSFAEERGFYFMEVSAKENTDQCVIRGFNILLNEIVENMSETNLNEIKKQSTFRSTTNTIIEKKKQNMDQKSKGCC